MKDLEKTFEYAKDLVQLSASEKASGRANLLAVMQDRPMRIPEAKPSAFMGFFSAPAFRYAIVAILFFSIGSGGVVFAAEDSKPASPLYAVKVKVTEPLKIAFTFDPKERTDLEVEIVNQRLKDLAEASVDGSLTTGQLALVSDSLSSTINDAQSDIAALSETGDAFESASGLAATLSAHAKILGKVETANPGSGIATVAATVSTELSETNTLADTAQDLVEDAATTTLETPSDEQANTSGDSLAKMRADVAALLSSFDTSDRADVEASLADIQATITAAQQKDGEGDTKAAYLLYVQANQQLTQLKTALEADTSLGIDIIDASTTAADPE